jgi:hypothetical protein
MKPSPPRSSRWQRATVVRALAGILASGFVTAQAHAVLVIANVNGVRSVTMRVGSANATVNTVTFDVLNANVSPTPTPVTGVPGNGTPATAPANGTEVEVIAQVPNNEVRTLTLSVNSTPGLSCIAGTGCGTTIIPFTTIAWTSFNKEAGALAGQDIQDGVFTGGANQVLATGVVDTTGPGTGFRVTMTNVLIFRYANATVYPSGRYTGRVVYTVTNL